MVSPNVLINTTVDHVSDPYFIGHPTNQLLRRDYGAKVLGFDLSVNMIDIAQERLGPFSKFQICFTAFSLAV